MNGMLTLDPADPNLKDPLVFSGIDLLPEL